MLEAMEFCENISGKKLDWTYQETNRVGDHIWWINNVRNFKNHYPKSDLTFNVRDILTEIFGANSSRWSQRPISS